MQNKKSLTDGLKKYGEVLVVLSAIITATITTMTTLHGVKDDIKDLQKIVDARFVLLEKNVDNRFNVIEKDMAVIKTFLVIKEILPRELATKE